MIQMSNIKEKIIKKIRQKLLKIVEFKFKDAKNSQICITFSLHLSFQNFFSSIGNFKKQNNKFNK